MSESRNLARGKGIEALVWGGKGGLHNEGTQVSRRREKESKENLSRRSRRKYEPVSGFKSLTEGGCQTESKALEKSIVAGIVR